MRLSAMLDECELIVGDGAMGSELMARGMPAQSCGEVWNIERPDLVEAVQREYVAAGAQYLLTNTFGGNPIALARHNLAHSLEDVNREAVAIARKAGREKTLILGDVGPSGELLAPLGTLAGAEARRAFAAQVHELASAGVDAVILETFDSLEELRVALEAARESCDLPLIASIRFQDAKGGAYRTMMGEAPEQFVEAACEAGCAALGTNCGQGIVTMIGLVEQLAGLTDVPIIAQPNAGLPQLVKGRTVYREDAAVFARHVPALHDAGAWIIGGCCGTTAEHVRAIRHFADSLCGRG